MRNAERIRSPFPLALGLALALAARPAAWSAPPEPGAEPEPAADLADYLADESALTEEADTVVTAALYAQLIASARFDFPQPLGPTTAVNPCPRKRSSVRSAKDLNPWISRRLM